MIRRGLNKAPSIQDARSTLCAYWQMGDCTDSRCLFMHSHRMHAYERTASIEQWEAQVRQILRISGGTSELCSLAGKAPLPQQHRGPGLYPQHLEARGFCVSPYGVVSLAAGHSRRRDESLDEEPSAQRRRTDSSPIDDAREAQDAAARSARAKRFGIPAVDSTPVPKARVAPAPAAGSTAGGRFVPRAAPASRVLTPEKEVAGGRIKLVLNESRLYQPRDAEQRDYVGYLQSAMPIDDKVTGSPVLREPGQPARRGIVVAIGTQGAGKTALAIQEGLRALTRGLVDRIVVSRPNIHAKGDGEGLGFLPGSEIDKLRPLAGPVLDHIDEFTSPGTAERLLKSGQLKLCSFEYMRGTTFKRSWVIADEIQNASLTQLKLLTGRYGDGSKMCILGDPEQCDRKRAHWEKSSLYALVEHIKSGATSEAWACVTFRPQNCHRHSIARESLDVMDGVQDRTDSGDHGAAAGYDRGRMFGGALRGMDAQCQ